MAVQRARAVDVARMERSVIRERWPRISLRFMRATKFTDEDQVMCSSRCVTSSAVTANASSRPGRQRTVSKSTTTKPTRRHRTTIDERAHGMTPARWARLRAKTNDQVLSEARADPDALPADDRKARLGRVARVLLAKRIHWALHMSQVEFAKTFRIPLGTLRDREQHRRDADQAAQAYLEVIAREPDAVRRALARAAKAA
jgi:putative transcriptional regulator